jgi:hypothetical protein
MPRGSRVYVRRWGYVSWTWPCVSLCHIKPFGGGSAGYEYRTAYAAMSLTIGRDQLVTHQLPLPVASHAARLLC